jgi:hypothetical protein
VDDAVADRKDPPAGAAPLHRGQYKFDRLLLIGDVPSVVHPDVAYVLLCVEATLVETDALDCAEEVTQRSLVGGKQRKLDA